MSNWIKVEDELPNAGQYILFCSINGFKINVYTAFGTFCRSNLDGDVFVSFMPDVEDVTRIYSNITHWMPLPEPPES